jgi:hypothetical protein
MDLNIVAYATLALSLFVSAVKMGGWILNADPRAIISAGRWALAGLPILSIGALSWLIATGRWTAAMLVAAFLLPVFVQAAPRWRVLLDPFFGTSHSGIHPFASDLGGSVVPSSYATTRPGPDPHLVAQSIAVLRDYVEQSSPHLPPPRPQITHRPTDAHDAEVEVARSVDGSRLSTAEAFEVLGLKPTPSPREVKEAHRRLAQLLHSELGDTHYLIAKIDEARDVLLGD